MLYCDSHSLPFDDGFLLFNSGTDKMIFMEMHIYLMIDVTL